VTIRSHTLPPLTIGDLRIDFPVALAPMAGFTDAVFRPLCMQMGCGLTVTELTNAAGLVHGSKRSVQMLATGPQERPVGAHIYGSDPETMAGAAAAAAGLERFSFIDINAGCPASKIVRRGDGVGLMRDPAKLEKMVRMICAAVSLPVTVKTRLGISPETENILDVARAAEQGGASALFLHARFAVHRHSGPADWDRLAGVKQALGIPVVGNGGISRGADVFRMLEEAGVDGVMIGRAALGNPWIFREIRCLARGREFVEPGPQERRHTIMQHLEELVALVGKNQAHLKRHRYSPEHAAVLAFRGHLVNYLSGRPGWNEVRRKLNDMASIADVAEALSYVRLT